jgi:catechol 2,3-dioxygenase-like lactoylglutathione lyase family enzyme
MDPWPKGISAITLFVEDLAAARGFYRDVFGLPLFFEDDSSVGLPVRGNAGQPPDGERGIRADRSGSGRLARCRIAVRLHPGGG